MTHGLTMYGCVYPGWMTVYNKAVCYVYPG